MMKKEFLAPAVATSFTIIAGAILLSTNVTADTDVIDVMTLGVPESCTMSGTGMTSHTDEIENGTYSSDIGTTTLHVFCNDNAGFAVYAVGYTDDEFGKNVLTNSTLGSTYDIVTGTATSGSTSNWAMKLAITQDSGDTTGTNAFVLDNSFGSYHNVPATYTKVAHKNTSTDMTNTTGGVKLTTTYAALISPNQPAGTYTGQVKYTLVHPASEIPLQPVDCPSGKICYNPNGGNVVGTMGQPTVSTSDTSTTLLASNFSRDGYGFAGWNDRYDYSGNFYGPNEDITFTAGQYTGSNPGLALYAVWVKSAGSFQDTSKVSALCSTGTGSLTTAPSNGTASLTSVSALTDQRDNETYAIAKLADGKCWMIENLRLEAEDTIDAEDKNLAQGYGVSTTYGNFTGLATAENANFDTNATANSLYSIDGSTTNTIQGGDSDFYYARIPRYNNLNTQNRTNNPTSNIFNASNTIGGMYSYGNYYTQAATIANVKPYTTPTSIDDEGKTSETANTSLCPKGWKLPRGGDKTRELTNDFWTLIVTSINGDIKPANYDSLAYPNYAGTPEGSNVSMAVRSFPNNFLFSGLFVTSNSLYRGEIGYYRTSTISDNGFTGYTLQIQRNSRVYPGTSASFTGEGDSIRCLADL